MKWLNTDLQKEMAKRSCTHLLGGADTAATLTVITTTMAAMAKVACMVLGSRGQRMGECMQDTETDH